MQRRLPFPSFLFLLLPSSYPSLYIFQLWCVFTVFLTLSLHFPTPSLPSSSPLRLPYPLHKSLPHLYHSKPFLCALCFSPSLFPLHSSPSTSFLLLYRLFLSTQAPSWPLTTRLPLPPSPWHYAGETTLAPNTCGEDRCVDSPLKDPGGGSLLSLFYFTSIFCLGVNDSFFNEED